MLPAPEGRDQIDGIGPTVVEGDESGALAPACAYNRHVQARQAIQEISALDGHAELVVYAE